MVEAVRVKNSDKPDKNNVLNDMFGNRGGREEEEEETQERPEEMMGPTTTAITPPMPVKPVAIMVHQEVQAYFVALLTWLFEVKHGKKPSEYKKWPSYKDGVLLKGADPLEEWGPEVESVLPRQFYLGPHRGTEKGQGPQGNLTARIVVASCLLLEACGQNPHTYAKVLPEKVPNYEDLHQQLSGGSLPGKRRERVNIPQPVVVVAPPVEQASPKRTTKSKKKKKKNKRKKSHKRRKDMPSPSSSSSCSTSSSEDEREVTRKRRRLPRDILESYPVSHSEDEAEAPRKKRPHLLEERVTRDLLQNGPVLQPIPRWALRQPGLQPLPRQHHEAAAPALRDEFSSAPATPKVTRDLLWGGPLRHPGLQPLPRQHHEAAAPALRDEFSSAPATPKVPHCYFETNENKIISCQHLYVGCPQVTRQPDSGSNLCTPAGSSEY